MPPSLSLRVLVDFLKPAEIYRLSLVSRAWRRLTANNDIWWPLCVVDAWHCDSAAARDDFDGPGSRSALGLAPPSCNPASMSKAARKLDWRATWIDSRRARVKHEAAMNALAQARGYATPRRLLMVGELCVPVSSRLHLCLLSSLNVAAHARRQKNRHEWQNEAAVEASAKIGMRAFYQGEWNKKPVGKKPSHRGRDEKLEMAGAFPCADDD